MKRNVLIVLALVAVLFLAGWTLQASNQPTMKQRWEYRAVTLKHDSRTEDMLNGFGAGGWELISTETVKESDETRFYFKRLK